ncbi:MAG: lipopolysaccharide biosynthesis protein [Prevotella sp.]|nr:lipopolysaccharide biosynthesis protein [Prevotella sp.]
METETQKNKRIAKNTILLYIRMVFSMLVALYTSRVILNALGENDYGIYGVVGGIVVFFNVISGSLNAAISRFITYELGKGNVERLNKVFCTSLNIQFLMSVVFLVFAEIIGVWFLENKMNIPEGRMYAAHWVLQCSILSFIVGLISVPYNATIIAHEHMGAFAYLSILSTFLNLGVALVINHVSFDKLIFYALAIVGINILMRIIYGVYCKFHFQEAHWHFVNDKELMKKMTSFAGWNFLGASSGVLLGQGVNILMNIFFGVAVNAARSIASQVDNAVNMLVNNFTMALNPQITKSYASGDMTYMHDLVCKGAKYSFFIMLIPTLPILLETPQILVLWLKQVPVFSVVFVRLTLLISLVSVLSQTLITSMLASGRIKKYQIIISSLSYSIFLLAYLAYKIGLPPFAAYIIQLIVFLIELVVRLFLLRQMVSLPIKVYLRSVILNIFIVVIVASVLPMIVMLSMNESLLRLLIICVLSFICVLFAIYGFGLSSRERIWVNGIIRKVVSTRVL